MTNLPGTVTLKSKLAVVLLLAISINAKADQPASPASVETFLELTDARQLTEAGFAQVISLYTDMARQLGITDKEDPVLKKYLGSLDTLLEAEMGWEKVKGPIIEMYSSHFTDTEMQGLIAFYQSDLGRKTVETMPLAIADTVKISQTILTAIMPKIQALAIEMRTAHQDANN